MVYDSLKRGVMLLSR